jgi:hypothetical protein
VIVKFNLNERAATRLTNAGIILQSVDWQEREKKHTAQAQAHDRQPHRYRTDVADSGVPVFGPDGLNDVSLGRMFREIAERGYVLVDIHLLPHRKNQWAKVLVMIFKEGTSMDVPPSAAEPLRNIMGAVYGVVHVWANPPDKAGNVVHTVNCITRRDAPPRCELAFYNEWFEAPIWDAVEVVTEQA